ncbi:hypothetical protein MMC12_005313 [Toensbergia leucococca]|nr:hypothetical protein [Toensbergia leucococca]
MSDTHNFEFEDGFTEKPQPQPLRLPLPKVDVLLHCGDLTQCGGSSSFKKAVKMLGAIDAELKLVIAGNHDLELDEEYWTNNLDEGDEPEDHIRATNVVKGHLAADAGVKYLDEGTYDFTLKNGARFTIYASPYSPAFLNWAFAYEHTQDRFNEAHQVADGVESIAKHSIPSFPNVDIVMTHGPPKGILDHCQQGIAGCGNLLQALRRARPRIHCFGHIHEGNGMKVVDWDSQENGPFDLNDTREHDSQGQSEFENMYPRPTHFPLVYGKQSLMVNAAIMNGENEASNAPWLIYLELPSAAS